MKNKIAKSLENKYIYLSAGDMEVQVKIEHEGIVVDVFRREEIVATTYRFFHELGINVKEILSK
jgi:cytochrome c-type biogenesis protein CcmE